MTAADDLRRALEKATKADLVALLIDDNGYSAKAGLWLQWRMAVLVRDRAWAERDAAFEVRTQAFDFWTQAKGARAQAEAQVRHAAAGLRVAQAEEKVLAAQTAVDRLGCRLDLEGGING